MAAEFIQAHPIGPNMLVAEIALEALVEQDVNAQRMEPRKIERLSQNIRERGALESLPYTTATENGVEIISGHHRVRAARAAGLDTIWVLVDLDEMSRSTIRSKQIAHNELVGESDEEVLREMVREIVDVNDLLATGLPDDLLPLPDPDFSAIDQARTDFDWRIVEIVLLPRQHERFREIVDRLDGKVDEVGVAPVECFADFATYLSRFQRLPAPRSMGTTVAVLTRIARDMLEMNERTDTDGWVRLESVFLTEEMPAEVGTLVRDAIAKRLKRDKLQPEHLWRVLERWAAEELAR